MGSFQIVDTGTVCFLESGAEIGRECELPRALRLDRLGVSRRHARFEWTAGTWTIRDLHSANGTRVDGQALSPGASAPLTTGMTVRLGPSATLRMLDAGEPAPFAVHRSTGEHRGSDVHGEIALPDGIVRVDVELGWVLGGIPTVRRVGDWDLRAPEMDCQGLTNGLRVGTTVRATFLVPQQGQRAGLILDVFRQEVHVPADAAIYVVFLLARERKAGGDGWVDVVRLAGMAGESPERVDMQIARARRLLAFQHVGDAWNLVEARDGRRRIGFEADRIA